MGGMFMCTIHKQQFLYSSVIKLFQQTEMGDYRKFKKKNVLVKQLNSKAVTIRQWHQSMLPHYEARFSLPLLYDAA